MSLYILNTEAALRERVAELLRIGLWGVGPDELHGATLAAGDRVLVYLGAPAREFVACAELASPVHPWTSSEAQLYPGDLSAGVQLAEIERWDPPVAMSVVLSHLDASAKAKADFDMGVVRITEHEHETVLALARG